MKQIKLHPFISLFIFILKYCSIFKIQTNERQLKNPKKCNYFQCTKNKNKLHIEHIGLQTIF